MSQASSSIKVDKIMAAIVALERAIAVLYVPPHFQDQALAIECIKAMVGLKVSLQWATRDIDIPINTEEAA